jgi:hypothetical protein
MKKTALLVIGLVLLSIPSLAGEYLVNDTGEMVYRLRVVFSEPVELTGFGNILVTVQPLGESAEFAFSGCELEAWDGHWLNWEPVTATLDSHEWLTNAPPADSQEASAASAANWPEGRRFERVGQSTTDYSYGLAIADGVLWMANRTSGQLLTIDPADGSILSTFPVSSKLTGVTFDGEFIWTCSEFADVLFRVDPTSGEILGRLNAPGSRPAGLAWDGEALWCVDRDLDAIFRIDPTLVILEESPRTGTASGTRIGNSACMR